METYSYEDEDDPQKREEKRPWFGVLEGYDKAVTNFLGTKSLGRTRSWHHKWNVPKYFKSNYPGHTLPVPEESFKSSKVLNLDDAKFRNYLRFWEGFQCKPP